MVHTAKFYLMVEDEEVYKLEKKHKENITLIGSKLDGQHMGLTTTFIRRYNNWLMFVTVDFIKLLGRCDIVEQDYKEIEQKIGNFLFYIFGENKELILIRLDYRLDFQTNDKERELLLTLYGKALDKYRFKKKYNIYKSSIYFNSKSMQIVIYDKEIEKFAKGKDKEEFEKNILRFEVRLQNRHINYLKRTYGLEKVLQNYLTERFWEKYMVENLGCFLYFGNYYKIYMAEKIINNSNIKDRDKHFIREFLVDVSIRGVTGAKNMINENQQNKYTKYTFNKAMKILVELNINPILIPKNLKGIPSFLENPLNSLLVPISHGNIDV